jgi:Ca2+-binding RTX toxin-like protein
MTHLQREASVRSLATPTGRRAVLTVSVLSLMVLLLAQSGADARTAISDLHNDNFVNAQTITGNSGAVSSSNAGATGESGEPNNAGVSSPIQSLWYKWTAPSTGTWSFDTCGSSFDTTLGVYFGTSVSQLTTLSATDDDYTGACGLQSRVAIATFAGNVYRISLDGFSSASGNFTLTWHKLICTINGTPGPDALNGTPGNDVICGLGGNDIIAGAAGNDTVVGGPGNDKVRGESGTDFVVGGSGSDNVQGGSGVDIVTSVDFEGIDQINGGPDNDHCYWDTGDTVAGCP